MINDFKISLANQNDLDEVFDLSNDLIVRKSSFHPNSISYDSHVIWFKQKIDDKNSAFFIIRTKKNDFIGYVRFDKDISEFDVYIITIHLSEQFRGKRLGSKLIEKTSELLFQNYNVLKIYAYIKIDNIGSLKSFLKVDYRILFETEINGFKCLKLICEK